MCRLRIEHLQFEFPGGWQASKYDDWAYYRNQFAKQRDSLKAVDIVALSPEKTAFLIEVKDYRHPGAVKPSQLAEAIANKVLHTLAALLAARLRAHDLAEKDLAAAITACRELRIVVHIELPQQHDPVVDLADIKQKLKSLLRAVDPHPQIVSSNKMASLAWNVSSCKSAPIH